MIMVAVSIEVKMAVVMKNTYGTVIEISNSEL
jgi:hypothetical protein